MEKGVDAEYLRDTIGIALYDRVMQWNDSGATEALLASQQRKKARSKRKPCWVPKLKNDLYVNVVDWENHDAIEEMLDIPRSAVGLAEEQEKSTVEKSEQGCLGVYSDGMKKLVGNVWNEEMLDISSSVPFMVNAVLEDCVDGRRLVVEGQPIEPSGWGDLDLVPPPVPDGDGTVLISTNPPSSQVREAFPSLAESAFKSESVDGLGGWVDSHLELPLVSDRSCLVVDSVLHDFGNGPRLLVGGWPVEPSWEQPDHNWAHLGCNANMANSFFKNFYHMNGDEYVPDGHSRFEAHYMWRLEHS